MSEPVVSLQHISWIKDRKPILKDVTWRIEPGQHWALIGTNGSGKTSLLNIINGYLWPSRGSASVLGTDFGKASLQTMRQDIGWVSSAFLDKQLTGHPEDPVINVVLSGKYATIGSYRDYSQEDYDDARAALSHFDLLDGGYRPLQSLSQGEKQRVLLARAIIRHPRLLILDEPCTGLDVPTREAFLRSLQDLITKNTPWKSSFSYAKGHPGIQDTNTVHPPMTVIYVTHHVEEIMPWITHAMVLSKGTVVAAGEKQEILTHSVLEEAFGISLDVTWEGQRPWLHTL